MPLEERPFKIIVIAGSARRIDGCPGLDSKARALMHRMIGQMPTGWQVDHEDISNERGNPKIQGCNGCVGSSMALCVWPCNCYGPRSKTQPGSHVGLKSLSAPRARRRLGDHRAGVVVRTEHEP